MNIVKETNQSSKVNRVTPILPFYHRCDLDFAPDEITIDNRQNEKLNTSLGDSLLEWFD